LDYLCGAIRGDCDGRVDKVGLFFVRKFGASETRFIAIDCLSHLLRIPCRIVAQFSVQDPGLLGRGGDAPSVAAVESSAWVFRRERLAVDSLVLPIH
jgi:hypothetical protein